MEDKMLKICKEVVKAKIIPCENEDILCRDCIFNVCEDCKNYKTTSEIAQKYIKEHGKTVNIIENIEEKIKLKELQEIKKDNIVPTYYHKGNYDVIQFCLDNDIDFVTGNIIKYITRYKGKNGIEDLKKAKEYINRSNGMEYEISLADLVYFNLENNLDYTQGKIIELVLDSEITQAKNVLDDLIEKEKKKIKEIEETYQTEGMAD